MREQAKSAIILNDDFDKKVLSKDEYNNKQAFNHIFNTAISIPIKKKKIPIKINNTTNKTDNMVIHNNLTFRKITAHNSS